MPIGAIAVISALKVLPNVKSGDAGRLDAVGLGLMALGLPLLTYGLAEIGEHRQIHVDEGDRADA